MVPNRQDLKIKRSSEGLRANNTLNDNNSNDKDYDVMTVLEPHKELLSVFLFLAAHYIIHVAKLTGSAKMRL
jgi:hypothetical protein